MLKSLELVNWKSHSYTKLAFDGGTNLFIGSMGSGKTSCLEAICYALYGTFPSLKSHKVSLDDVVKTGENASKIKVSLIAPDGLEYSVERTIATNGGEANLRDSTGRLLEGPQPKRTTEAVLNLLKIDYDLFTRAIYSEQNKIDHFINLPKGDRKKQLDALLGLDSFETARANAVTLINTLKYERDSLQLQLENLKPVEVNTQKNELEEKIKSLILERDTCSEKLNVLNENLAKIKNNVTLFEENKKQGLSIQNEITKLSAQIHAIQIQANSLSKMEISYEQAIANQKVATETLSNIKKLTEQINEAKTAIGKLEGQKTTLENQTSGFEMRILEMENKALEEIQTQISDLTHQSKFLQEQLTSAATQVKVLTLEFNEYEKKKKELEPKIAQHVEFESKHKSIELLSGKITTFEVKETNLIEDISKTDAQIEVLKTALKLLEATAANCPTCDSSLESDKKTTLKAQKLSALQKLEKETRSIKEALVTTKAQLLDLKTDRAKWQQIAPYLQTTLTPIDENKLNEAKQLHVKLIRQAELITSQLTEKQTIYREQTLRVSKLRTQHAQVIEITRFESQILQRQKEEKDMQTELSVLGSYDESTAELQRIKDHLKRIELENSITSLQGQIVSLENRKKEIKYGEKEHEVAVLEMQKLLIDVVKLQSDLNTINNLFNEKNARLTQVNSQLNLIREINDKLNVVQNKIHELTIYSAALIQTQETLRNELIGAINEALKSIWLEVYPYGDYVSLQLFPTKSDYEVQIKRLNNEWIDIERVSGGEKTCASLSLRVALSMVLAPNLSWLVLDEPTHNLDSTAVNLLARALHDSIPRIVRQTFIITHDEKLKEAATASIHKFERNKNQNQPTVVELVS